MSGYETAKRRGALAANQNALNVPNRYNPPSRGLQYRLPLALLAFSGGRLGWCIAKSVVDLGGERRLGHMRYRDALAAATAEEF